MRSVPKSDTMKYLLSILLPPLAVYHCGSLRQPYQRVQLGLSVALTLCFWIPGVIFALWVMKGYLASCRRTDRMLAAVCGKRASHRSFRLSTPDREFSMNST
jgi:uncharacterized membrane protein YqaE (UPF0057 family)